MSASKQTRTSAATSMVVEDDPQGFEKWSIARHVLREHDPAQTREHRENFYQERVF